MKLAFGVLVLVVVSTTLFFWKYTWSLKLHGDNSTSSVTKAKPLDKYTIENLSKTNFEKSKIEIGELLKADPDFSSRMFYFWVAGKKVSGQINIPNGSGPFGVIVMYRGYIDQKIYKTGDGTRRAGEVFAKNGYVTVAPDFLGYGQSDMPSENVIEERFQTYVTAITLLKSIGNLNSAFEMSDIGARVDSGKVGLWGHSNGGQFALTMLEVTGANVPTVLWAPVSKPFPYSILYYTDDIDDHGKMLRKVVADFERDYDSEKYSLTNYIDKINAPIQINQGTADEAVPVKWSDELVKTLKEKDKTVDYFTYSGDDHNFTKGSWQAVVGRSVEFYHEGLGVN